MIKEQQISDSQLNQTQKIHYSMATQRLNLKPYCKSYVKQYNQWFSQDPELLYLTGSQPLTLQQQYENHKAWLTDSSKYTFIIFEKLPQSLNSKGQTKERMIGDINLFFSQWIQQNECQINIMIARKEDRGKGYAKQALSSVQIFARAIYDKNQVIAKIKKDNVSSKRLFEKSGYSTVNFSQSFQEYELRKKLLISKQQAKKLLRCNLQMTNVQNQQYLYSV